MAAAGRRRRTGRWSAAALRAPLYGVGVHVGGGAMGWRVGARARGTGVQ